MPIWASLQEASVTFLPQSLGMIPHLWTLSSPSSSTMRYVWTASFIPAPLLCTHELSNGLEECSKSESTCAVRVWTLSWLLHSMRRYVLHLQLTGATG
eukprot:COSAG02_NODE_1629_length_11581_cov_5.858735_2_plen_98_part_00